MNPNRPKRTQHPNLKIRALATARGRKFSRCPFRFSAALGVCVALAATVTAHGRDILRPGSGTIPSAQGIATGASSGAIASQARANALDAMARTTRALQSVQAMQTAARAAAIAGPNNLGVNPNNKALQLPNVPNGIVAGGLVPDSGLPAAGAKTGSFVVPPSWTGVGGLTQTSGGSSGGTTTVNIQQTSQQAVLNWNQFNIGKQTTVAFDQSAGGANANQWIAFNKITDPSGVPSQILGSITAQGQVYVINQNGIIFGGSSQVNTHALVASSLPINENLISRGLLNNPDSQFLFTSLPQLPGSNGTPGFTPPAAPNGQSGDVTVQAGAQLSSPTTADHTGGRIALVGPNVTNAGTIATPDGQTIIASGQQVGFAPHSSSDASVRGLDVYVGAVDATSGTATNSGLIDAPRANVTMTGKNVNQLGVINSTTSVSLNGSISLFADYNAVSNVLSSNPSSNASNGGLQSLGPYLFLPQASGTVTLGPGSAMQILPEMASTDTVTGSMLALQSLVKIQGQAIYLAPNSTILAPNAMISLSSGIWKQNSGADYFAYTSGQVYLDSGALINAAGSVDVAASVTENIIQVQLRGAELANSPLQRNGALRGQTVTVDIRDTGVYDGVSWIGSPIGDLQGYANLVAHTVGELTTNGGTVTLNAGGSVVMQPGSKIDVSGGWINYQGATVQTTRLISGGQIVDISQATPDRIYSGIFTGQFADTHPKWSITNKFASPLAPTGSHYEQGYIFGGNGGQVTIFAPGMALDGTLLGTTVAGPKQRQPQTTVPFFSSLSLIFKTQDSSNANGANLSPTPPNIIFDDSTALPAAYAFKLDSSGAPLPLRPERTATVLLSSTLTTTGGFGSLYIENNDGNVTVPSGVSLATLPEPKAVPVTGPVVMPGITIKAANIYVNGSVSAPGGAIEFDAYNLTIQQAFDANTNGAVYPPNVGRGLFYLGPTGSISTAGLVTDDRPGMQAGDYLPLINSGGTIAINGYKTVLSTGALVDVSGGVYLSATGKQSYGTGGTLSISGARDLNIPSVLGGSLTLGAALAGFSGGVGGTLNILAPAIQIGGSSANSSTLVLSPDFFSQGGFTKYSLTGIGIGTGVGQSIPGVLVTAGAQVTPVAFRRIAYPYWNGTTSVGFKEVLPDAGVRTPVNITLKSIGQSDPDNANNILAEGDTVIQKGALIRTDPEGNITLSGNTVTVLGSIIAPGGNITVQAGFLSGTLAITVGQVLPNIDLGPMSVLSTAGITILTPDPRNHRTGIVLNGGNITLSGNIVGEAGSVIDVSGASGILDIAPTATSFGGTLQGSFRGSRVVATRIESNGGVISLKGKQELFMDGTLLGTPGGTSANGGSLIVQSGIYQEPNSQVQLTPLDVSLLIIQRGPTISVPFYPAGGMAVGHQVLDKTGNPFAGQGYFAADIFNGHGFDNLTLNGTVQFSGPVTLVANRSIAAGSGGVLFGDSTVNLVAPYVVLGTGFQPPVLPSQVVGAFPTGSGAINFPPSYGAGVLNVQGRLIDIGNLSLQGFGTVNLVAANGDIRGNGTLDFAGKISLTANQIYPPTAVSFNIFAYDYTAGGKSQMGTVTIAGSSTSQLPLSAGGQLNIYGSVINQGGVLRAPFGSINIGWDGTASSTPTDLIAGGTATIPVTQQVTLQPGSVTSVSAVDPSTGRAIIVPYGTNLNGTSWIDPFGTDITLSGLGGKGITVSALSVVTRPGSVLNIQGGGDVYAYQWVSGLGGSSDILASNGNFAVIPGYSASYAPYAPFSTQPITTNLGSDPGYVNSNLNVGDSVYLSGGGGLAAGTYTLLPSRYALLAGAYLVTPQGGTPVGTLALPSGGSLMSGYAFNALRQSGTAPSVLGSYYVASGSVMRQSAQYEDYYGNTFFTQSAAANNAVLNRLPGDAGFLVLSASQAVTLRGSVFAEAPAGSRGGVVDISSALNIFIGGPGATAGAGVVVLDSSELTSFGAESLLIGGARTTNGDSTSVKVSTGNITVSNAGGVLAGTDVILAATQSITVTDGSQISAVGVSSSIAQPLTFGTYDASGNPVPGSGNGVLLRVSTDPLASISRIGVNSATMPLETVGKATRISGRSVILDSTSATSLDPTARLSATAITLDSGQISIQLTNAGPLQTNNGGLVLAGPAVQSLQSAQTLSLLSYSSVDVYGSGTVGSAALENLQIHAAEIRRMDSGLGGSVSIAAQNMLLDNSAGGTSPGPGAATPSGTLSFGAATIQLGTGTLAVDGYSNVQFNASSSVISSASGATVTQGALTIATPFITGAAATSRTLAAGGALALVSPGAAGTPTAGGLGANFSFTGTSVTANTAILLPSGTLAMQATAGDLTVGGTLDVGGSAEAIFDSVNYTNGGQITLGATGDVTVQSGSALRVSANPGGGNAGTLSITAGGSFILAANTLFGSAGANGNAGSFSIDVSSIPLTGSSAVQSLKPINDALNTGQFFSSRTFRIRSGDVVVDGLATAQTFSLSADQGSIAVAKNGGSIDASGVTGGTINLIASGSVILEGATAPGDKGAVLNVAAQQFNDAGKGGAISLEAGSSTNGSFSNLALGAGPQLDIQSGSSINLTVAAATTPAADAALGHFTGTLHLRAPQTAGNTDLQILPIGGTITGASLIRVEGYQLFNLQQGGQLTNSGSIQAAGGNIGAGVNVQGSVYANGQLFGGNSVAIANRLLPGNGAVVVEPGAEIINLTGNITLGAINSTATSDWNLSTFRYGTNNAPGVLTLRAAKDVVFYNMLSDGFATNVITLANATGVVQVGQSVTGGSLPANTVVAAVSGNQVTIVSSASATVPTGTQLNFASGTAPVVTATATADVILSAYNSMLLGQNSLLPANAQSYSYRIVSGADLAAADFTRVLPLSQLVDPVTHVPFGSLLLGKDYGTNVFTTGVNATTSSIVATRYQVIRTGSGDITISAGRDVRLLNQFATIYTAGTRVGDPTMGGTFDVPTLSTNGGASSLGAIQEPTPYAAQYSMAGGNVAITAQDDIAHKTVLNGVLLDDSSKELPINWLDRRGWVAADGTFGSAKFGGTTTTIASTTWWTDFSNFFEGVGTLGGGNLTMSAGHDVSNVDGVVATNARMPKGTPNAASLLELGGGDLAVRAGNNINAGVYYVERGNGILSAGGQILTNSTRAPSPALVNGSTAPISPLSWLPTTLFLGKGSLDVSANGNVLLGPVSNAFLLPEGYNNAFWYKTYFSTYAASDAVNVTSVGGSVTVRTTAVAPNNSTGATPPATPLLLSWLTYVSLLNNATPTASLSYYQPWLRLDETDVRPFATLVTLMPPTLKATALSGDINLVGNLTLSPSPTGNVELAATGSINGLQPDGFAKPLNTVFNTWAPSTINLSDADPSRLPGITSPLAYRSAIIGNANAISQNSSTNSLTFLQSVDLLFEETGSFTGTNAVLQTKQALHAPGILHASDANPLLLYAESGDISGVTLFSGKEARIVSGKDIADFAFYIQNTTSNDITLVSAARDIIAYDPTAALRTAATSGTNILTGGNQTPLAGDIQISGPGAVEVLAGRNLTAGIGPNNADGTGVGITSIGDQRNPYLPSTGAQIIAGAGISYSLPDFSNFISLFLDPSTGGASASRYLPDLAGILGIPGASDTDTWAAYNKLAKPQRELLTLDTFYLVLRDAGRDYNDPSSAGYKSYSAGFAAISALFPGNTVGNIDLTSREIKTQNGGGILLLAPGGKVIVGIDLAGNQALDQGILTEAGGGISIFAKGNVDVGTSRIFTLRGGDEVIWSSTGNIAAGASSKTVQSAPPTRVIVDPQSGDVKTDISGLATGGGIGVLASVAGVAPGSVDLVAPGGVIDAGDAGIRSTGKLNVAATQILNASNIQASGGSTGTPTVSVSAPNLGSVAASSSQAAATSSNNDPTRQATGGSTPPPKDEPPSVFTVEVLGYGGGEG